MKIYSGMDETLRSINRTMMQSVRKSALIAPKVHNAEEELFIMDETRGNLVVKQGAATGHSREYVDEILKRWRSLILYAPLDHRFTHREFAEPRS